jgi:hypothetical protein
MFKKEPHVWPCVFKTFFTNIGEIAGLNEEEYNYDFLEDFETEMN